MELWSIKQQGSIFGKAPPLEEEFFGNQGLGDPNSDNEHAYYPVDTFGSNWTVSEDRWKSNFKLYW